MTLEPGHPGPNRIRRRRLLCEQGWKVVPSVALTEQPVGEHLDEGYLATLPSASHPSSSQARGSPGATRSAVGLNSVTPRPLRSTSTTAPGACPVRSATSSTTRSTPPGADCLLTAAEEAVYARTADRMNHPWAHGSGLDRYLY